MNDSQTPDPVPAPITHNGSETKDLDGGFPIENDAGPVDNAGQAHTPPPTTAV